MEGGVRYLSSVERLEKKLDDLNNLLTGALSRIDSLEMELARSRQNNSKTHLPIIFKADIYISPPFLPHIK